MKKYIFGILFIILASLVASPTFADASSNYHYQYNRVLEHGSGGNDVVLAKYCLATIDNDFYDIHGYFDSRAKARVIFFQNRNGLTADGVIGPKTGAAMETACNRIFEYNRKPATSASIDFTFKVQNTTSKDIMLEGLHALVFELDEKMIYGDTLDNMDGYSVSLTDDKGKKLSGKRNYTIKPSEKVALSVTVDVEVNKTKKGTGEYRISLDHLDWRVTGNSKRMLKLNSISDLVYLKKS